MGKPLVHVQLGIAFEQFISDALDALLRSGDYTAAIELNSLLFDASSHEAALKEILKYVDIIIE